MRVFVCFSLLLAVAAVIPQFNESKCPSFWELQNPETMSNFKILELQGFYYELALHDYTQYPLCPSQPACISSNKTIRFYPDGVEYVNDAWNLYCLGRYYPQTRLFNVTENPGFLRGYVPTTLIPFLPKGIAADVVFPDTIVDFKPGPDGWVLEFQCVEHFGRVLFVGINFYSRTNTEAAYQEILAAGKARGLDFYWSKGEGLRRVNQTGC